MSLYHPMTSKPSRVDCLTPHEDYYSKLCHSVPSLGEDLKFLSPPLSPKLETHKTTFKQKSYLQTDNFKLENHKDYTLTINPWSSINNNYKKNLKVFLNQYNIHDSTPKRTYTKRKLDFEPDYEKMKTRRKAPKGSDDSDNNQDSLSDLSIKKKKLPSTPIAQQQQLLIDESIPDFSPDTFKTLPNNAKALKIEWKGQPMDLSNDINLSKLHPAEITLASILRLPANVYLDSKRRLFFEKVQRLKLDKQFRRTDAQKACRIDVNKASRLFAAFEKVGWLNDVHFEKFLN